VRGSRFRRWAEHVHYGFLVLPPKLPGERPRTAPSSRTACSVLWRPARAGAHLAESQRGRGGSRACCWIARLILLSGARQSRHLRSRRLREPTPPLSLRSRSLGIPPPPLVGMESSLAREGGAVRVGALGHPAPFRYPPSRASRSRNSRSPPSSPRPRAGRTLYFLHERLSPPRHPASRLRELWSLCTAAATAGGATIDADRPRRAGVVRVGPHEYGVFFFSGSVVSPDLGALGLVEKRGRRMSFRTAAAPCLCRTNVSGSPSPRSPRAAFRAGRSRSARSFARVDEERTSPGLVVRDERVALRVGGRPLSVQHSSDALERRPVTKTPSGRRLARWR